MKTLVIGYGNTLRGDDGVGYRVAETVGTWHGAEVEAYPCHQLTPDLAALLAEQERVVFVDAAPPQNPPSPLVLARMDTLAGSSPTFTGHHSHPATLMALTQQIYGQAPMAYTLLLPTWVMGYGEDLSPTAERGMQQALVWLWRWIVGHPGDPPRD